MVGDSWTHKAARLCILPLVHTPVTPNHLTTVRLVSGIVACGLIASGSRELDLVLSEFQLLLGGDQFDHMLLLINVLVIARFDEMVVTIQIAIVLDGQPLSAGLVKDAHA